MAHVGGVTKPKRRLSSRTTSMSSPISPQASHSLPTSSSLSSTSATSPSTSSFPSSGSSTAMFGSERERARAFSDGKERSRKPTFGLGGSGGHSHLVSGGYPFDDASRATAPAFQGEPLEMTVDLVTPPMSVDVGRANGLDTGVAIERGHTGTWYPPARTDGYAPVQVAGGNAASGKKESMKIFGIELKWISLITLALQNAALTVIMHYSRITASPSRTYSAASAVLLNELLKGTISLLIALKRVDTEMTKTEGHHLSPTGRRRLSGEVGKGLEREESPIRTTLRKGPPSSRPGRTAAGSLPNSLSRIQHAIAPYTKTSRWQRLYSDVISPDCWKLSIPAILYVIQNNLQYVAASNLDVATFQVTYQMKILTTAFFSVLMLRKRLTLGKWLALLLLAIGVGIVQIQSGNAGHTTTAPTAVSITQSAMAAVTGLGHAQHGLRADIPNPVVPDITEELPTLVVGESLSEGDIGHEMHRLTGFAAVSAACMTSGLAGVYFEMVLKGSKADLWVRNVQLSLFSLLPALLPVILRSGGGAASGGLLGVFLDPFRNFSLWAWGTVLTQVFGGLITALVIKYSDNILKGFATSLSIVISFLASVGLFAYPITPAFVLGSTIVLGATWMYNQPATETARASAANLSARSSSSSVGIPPEGPNRMHVAVPGSPIPANAPIIGETPKPSRASSFASLLGLVSAGSRSGSRSQTPAPTPPNPVDYLTYRNGSMINGVYSAPTTPQVPGNLLATPPTQSLHDQAHGYARANGYSPASASSSKASGAATSPGRTQPMTRRLSNRMTVRDRPKLELDTSDGGGKWL